MINFRTRQPGLCNIAKAEKTIVNDSECVNKQKKGLLIHSLTEFLPFSTDHLTDLLIPFVSQTRADFVPFLTQLDMINCESFTDINTYTCEEYKNMFKNYNILFIGSLVNIENQEITKELLHLIELKKISIVFLAFCPLVLQLNYLNNINERVESNYLYSNCCAIK
ncbi:hypothetical protein ABK040_010982 [Willaertia magna]